MEEVKTIRAEDDQWRLPGKARRVSFAQEQQEQQSRSRVMFREEEAGGGGSLGSYPTTPGPGGEEVAFPRQHNIDIVINTCEVRQV